MKNILIAVIGLLLVIICFLAYKNVSLNKEYQVEVAQVLILKQQRLIEQAAAEAKITQITTSLREIANQREKEYEEKYKALNDNFIAVKSKRDSLYVTTQVIDNSLHSSSAPREDLQTYLKRYSSVVNSCSSEYIKMEEESSRRGLIIKKLDQEIEDLYRSNEQFRKENEVQ